MSVSGISGGANVGAAVVNQPAEAVINQPAEAADKGEGTGVVVSEAAVYEPGTSEKGPVSTAEVRRMLEETEKQTQAMRDMILKMINRQASKNAIATGQAPEGVFNDLMSKIENGEEVTIEVDEETRAWAQAEIAEGGYYSVENTGDRILNFAVAIAGDDPEKLEKMREAVQAGFEAAEKQLGTELPQISKDTYDYVMKGFDERVGKTAAE